ncbi:MAG: T9SS type A sorting domain-containing protein [Ignavibacteriales bacterium]|nr:MAG: T9SS type A sorting domain-containing protein [Ignavibacteriales bacterium]
MSPFQKYFRTISFIIVLFSFYINLYSQVTLASESFTSLFTPGSFHYYTGVEGNINIGQRGGPNIYDFSSVSLSNLNVSYNYLVSTLPLLAQHYPSDAVAFGESETTIEKNPVFYIVNDTVYVAGEASLIPDVKFVHYVPFEIAAIFPATYGSSFSQQIEKYDTTFNGSGGVISTNYSTSFEETVIDGYGTLVLQSGSYQCLRIKKIHNGYGDKEYIYLCNEGAFVGVGGVDISAPDTGYVNGGCQVLLKPGLVDVNDNVLELNDFKLEQNYPNPFNPTTKIAFTIPEESRVRITIYDLLGNEVLRLLDEQKPRGSHTIDVNASELSSGVYLYRLKAGKFIQTMKMILLK